MLHNVARELLVCGYEATHDMKRISKAFREQMDGIPLLAGQKRKTGSADL